MKNEYLTLSRKTKSGFHLILSRGPSGARSSFVLGSKSENIFNDKILTKTNDNEYFLALQLYQAFNVFASSQRPKSLNIRLVPEKSTLLYSSAKANQAMRCAV